MRLASVFVAFIAVAAIARADIVKDHAGRIVISPDAPPTLATELAAYIKANVTKDDAYEAIKGSPWEIHLVGFLSADATDVTLEIGDLDKLPVAAKKRLVITSTKLTTAAGYVANKTYAVRLVSRKKVLARATLRLRD
ncbi:MAG: hypothetical protein M4D80_08740 [Myxococcota bacterium]|nr:hypothetical protein [Myxococcota bacterium]